MAKNFDPYKEKGEGWASRIPTYKDPVSGKAINSIGEPRSESDARQRPVPGVWKDSDK